MLFRSRGLPRRPSGGATRPCDRRGKALELHFALRGRQSILSSPWGMPCGCGAACRYLDERSLQRRSAAYSAVGAASAPRLVAEACQCRQRGRTNPTLPHGWY